MLSDMKISIACDHGAFELKTQVASYLQQNGYEVCDCGTFSADSCDYPDFAAKCARLVAGGECDKGIVLCTTGIGVSICANKVKGVRCALCRSLDEVELSRRHNNANVLAIGAKYTNFELAQQMVQTFLTTDFDGGRHERRVAKIELIEKGEL